MNVEEQVFFHLTGSRPGAAPAADGALRPALFARFRDLTKLRYDYPVVLLADRDEQPHVETLSGLIDLMLAEVAPKGLAGERMRRNVLRLEREIRVHLDAGEKGTLSVLWERCAEALALRGGAPLVEDLAQARGALHVDGELLPFDANLASGFVAHLWRARQARSGRAMRRQLDTLALKLADLVMADHLRSQGGRDADRLRSGIGAQHRDLFDFELMAKLLSAPSGESALSPRRRARIEDTLATLRSQRFFGPGAYEFEFDRVEDALAAQRGRAWAMAELVRAAAVAELELRGSYVEAKHDPYFDGFDALSLSAEDRAPFPDYLVRLDPAAGGSEGRARLIEALTGDAPLKVLFETGDPFGLGAQLATTAMGLGDAYVLQASASRLFAMRELVAAAMEFRGPALLSIFTGGLGPDRVPRYLVAAAADESRAFPAFSYDPSRGADWTQRIALHHDAQIERTWPEHELSFADEARQRTSAAVAFTYADFAICDPARAGHFARLARSEWNDRLVPLASWLDEPRPEAVPFVYAVDDDDRIYRLVVDARLAQSARRCADAWRRLRQLDDLKRERVVTPAAVVAPEPVAVAPGGASTEAASGSAEPVDAAPSTDEPYIETPRCTSCNECTNVNPRMFAYDGNKQAYIKDPSAGTFKDLVEAAEGCQVAIIHPGKPRDPGEPGLEDLLTRALAFR